MLTSRKLCETPFGVIAPALESKRAPAGERTYLSSVVPYIAALHTHRHSQHPHTIRSARVPALDRARPAHRRRRTPGSDRARANLASGISPDASPARSPAIDGRSAGARAHASHCSRALARPESKCAVWNARYAGWRSGA